MEHYRCVCLLVLSTLLFAIATGRIIGERPNDTSTNLCGRSPCPNFNLTNEYPDGIEERVYEAMNLPSYKSVACMEIKNAQSQGYFHLAMYTRAGLNKENRALPMGVPVMIEAKHVDDVEEKCSWVYTTIFYTTETSLPEPKTPEIQIKSIPEQRYYVLTFSGFIRDHKTRVVELREKLNALNLCYDPTDYIIAQYQSPNNLLNRRNEIWLPAKDCSNYIM